MKSVWRIVPSRELRGRVARLDAAMAGNLEGMGYGG